MSILNGIYEYTYRLYRVHFSAPSSKRMSYVNYMHWSCISWHENVCTHSFVHMHSSTFVHVCGCTRVFASECMHIHTRRARLVFD